ERTACPLQLSPVPRRRRAVHHLAQELATPCAARIRRHTTLFLAVVRQLLHARGVPRSHAHLRHAVLLSVRHPSHRPGASPTRAPRHGSPAGLLQCPRVWREPLRSPVARRPLASHAAFPRARRRPPACHQPAAGIRRAGVSVAPDGLHSAGCLFFHACHSDSHGAQPHHAGLRCRGCRASLDRFPHAGPAASSRWLSSLCHHCFPFARGATRSGHFSLQCALWQLLPAHRLSRLLALVRARFIACGTNSPSRGIGLPRHCHKFLYPLRAQPGILGSLRTRRRRPGSLPRAAPLHLHLLDLLRRSLACTGHPTPFTASPLASSLSPRHRCRQSLSLRSLFPRSRLSHPILLHPGLRAPRRLLLLPAQTRPRPFQPLSRAHRKITGSSSYS